MKLYVSSKALFKYKKNIESLFNKDGNLSIICTLNNGISLTKAHRIIKKKLKVYPVYCLKDYSISRKAFDFYKNGKANIELIINSKLNSFKKKLIKNTDRIIKITDLSECKENYEFYKSTNNVVFDSKFGSNLNDAIMFDFSYFNRTSFTCDYSSCLGNTLFLDDNGDFYFCFKNKENSLLKNIKECNCVDSIFEVDNFVNILNKSIEKRNNCKARCTCYKKCNGGCPLHDTDCDRFLKNLESTIAERNDIISSVGSLNNLPLYKKDSIIKEISKYPK